MILSKIFDRSAHALVDLVAERTVLAISHAWRESRDANIVLSGGRQGAAICKAIDFGLYRLISQNRVANSTEVIGKIQVWFADERFVTHDSADRNDTALISRLALSASLCTFHRYATPDQMSIEDSANQYALELKEALAGSRFDVVILSLGEDGHVASCFPSDESVLKSMKSVEVVRDSPKPPSQRLTLTLNQMAKSNQIYVFALGEIKRLALERTLGKEQAMPVELLRESVLNGNIFIITDLG
jgi:6-phosphogluconolactonase